MNAIERKEIMHYIYIVYKYIQYIQYIPTYILQHQTNKYVCQKNLGKNDGNFFLLKRYVWNNNFL